MEEKRNIRLVALDMDGTTLCGHDELSQENRMAIEAAIAQGVVVAFATGRAKEALPEVVKGIAGIRYAITSNGASVIDLQENRRIYRNEIEPEAVRTVLDLVTQYDIMVEAFADGAAYMDVRWKERLHTYRLPEGYKAYALATRHAIPDLFAFMRGRSGIENINLNFEDPALREQLYPLLQKLPGVTLTTSLPHNLELGGLTTSKADGLRALAEYLKIRQEDIMAMGDNENDRSMMEFAGLSVAVDNALPSIKAVSDAVVVSCENHGVAEAFQRFVLK